MASSGGDVPFVILGMGRLGLSEFDLASDATWFFGRIRVKPETWKTGRTWRRKRLTVLSSYTRDGTFSRWIHAAGRAVMKGIW